MNSPCSSGAHFAPAPMPILQPAAGYQGCLVFRNRAGLPTEHHRQQQRPPSPSPDAARAPGTAAIQKAVARGRVELQYRSVS